MGLIGAVAALLLSWVTGLLGTVWNYMRAAPPFAVVMDYANVMESSAAAMDGPLFWVLPGGRDGKVRIPVAAAFAFSITNMQPTPVTIEKFALQVTDQNGRWITLTRLQTSRGAAVMAHPSGRLLAEATHFLDRELAKRQPLASRATMAGWMFFEYPRPLRIVQHNELYRVTLADAVTEYTTRALKIPVRDPTWSNADPWVSLSMGDQLRPEDYRKSFMNP